MFENKKSSLSGVKKKSTTTSGGQSNGFLAGAAKVSAETLSENGAKKYSTTGSDFVDQFGNTASYKEPRKFADIASSKSILWAISPLLAVKFTLFLRTITRKVTKFDGTQTENPQRGSGLKHEPIMRMIWLAMFHSDTFWKNINSFISLGSWKDIFDMLRTDLEYNGWKDRQLDWEKMGKLILAGLENPTHSELIKKYLPQIKANSKCTTVRAQANNMIGKWLCSLLYGTKDQKSESKNYRAYRSLKTSGTAHEWQKLISKKQHNLIDFNTVHGRALAQLVSSKYIDNQGLAEAYDKWIEAQPVAKFTGYAFELFGKYLTKSGWSERLDISKKYQISTLVKQFDGLVEKAKEGMTTNTSLIVVRDTSGSMSSAANGTSFSANVIAKSLALYFSKLLTGTFANSWIEFNRGAKLHQWKGSNVYEQWQNDTTNAISSTNFQSVIDLFCQMKNQGIDESEFPSGILCISDGEFNPSELGQTNVETAYKKLRDVGFSEDYISNFQIILWNLRNRYYGANTSQKFETHGETKNVFYFSGFDGSIVAFLTGTDEQKAAGQSAPQTDQELFEAAMDQEILNTVEI